AEWRPEIEGAIARARVAVLLVSVDYGRQLGHPDAEMHAAEVEAIRARASRPQMRAGGPRTQEKLLGAGQAQPTPRVAHSPYGVYTTVNCGLFPAVAFSPA